MTIREAFDIVIRESQIMVSMMKFNQEAETREEMAELQEAIDTLKGLPYE